MTLSDYLRAHSLTHSEFAARIGATQAAVTRYANGRRKPSLEKIIVIERETDGQVRAIDFMPEMAGAGLSDWVRDEQPACIAAEPRSAA